LGVEEGMAMLSRVAVMGTMAVGVEAVVAAAAALA
jgi:hypothetical protein